MKPKQQVHEAETTRTSSRTRRVHEGDLPKDSALALMLVALPIHALTVVATVPRKVATTRRRSLARALAKSAQTREHEEVDGDVEASPTRHSLEMIPIHVFHEGLVIWCNGSALDNPDVSAMHGPNPMTKLLCESSNDHLLNMISLQPASMLHLATQRMAAGHPKDHHACS